MPIYYPAGSWVVEPRNNWPLLKPNDLTVGIPPTNGGACANSNIGGHPLLAAGKTGFYFLAGARYTGCGGPDIHQHEIYRVKFDSPFGGNVGWKQGHWERIVLPPFPGQVSLGGPHLGTLLGPQLDANGAMTFSNGFEDRASERYSIGVATDAYLDEFLIIGREESRGGVMADGEAFGARIHLYRVTNVEHVWSGTMEPRP